MSPECNVFRNENELNDDCCSAGEVCVARRKYGTDMISSGSLQCIINTITIIFCHHRSVLSVERRQQQEITIFHDRQDYCDDEEDDDDDDEEEEDGDNTIVCKITQGRRQR